MGARGRIGIEGIEGAEQETRDLQGRRRKLSGQAYVDRIRAVKRARHLELKELLLKQSSKHILPSILGSST